MKKMIVFLFAALLATLGGSACAALNIQSWTLDNGARVAFVENHTIPILDVSVDFDAGTRRDPPGKSGLASMTNSLLSRGIESGASAAEPALSEEQILNGFADIAAQRGGGADADRAGATVRTLSSLRERTLALNLLSRLLAQPSFPEDLLKRDQARFIAGLRESETKPEAIASRALWSAMYGVHPYAQQPTEASVQSLTRDDLVAFHRKHFVANRAVISMIGDLTREQADGIARQLTSRLPQGAPLPALADVPAAVGSEQRIAHVASQSHILLGMPSVVRGDPDYFALIVGNYVLGGGGFVSRLTNEVREKRGLTYGVSSSFSPLAQKGPFMIGLQTKQTQTDAALAVVRDTLAAFLRDGPTRAEVQAAQDNLIGGFALRIDNNRKILANISTIAYYGLPADYLDTWTDKVKRVTIADIRAAFQRKVAQQQLSVVVVGQTDAK